MISGCAASPYPGQAEIHRTALRLRAAQSLVPAHSMPHANGAAPGAADVAAIAAMDKAHFQNLGWLSFSSFQKLSLILGSTSGPEAARVTLSLSLRQIVSQNLKSRQGFAPGN